MSKTWSALLGCFGLIVSLAPAAAQGYPTRPIRFVVGFAPGGGADLIGRMIAGLLGEQLSRQVNVDNRPGAGGILAGEIVANAAPDGYTLLLVTMGHAISPWVHKLNYDQAKAFAAVALLGRGGYVLCVPPAVPAATVQELVALAKRKPGELLMGHSGAGSFQHLASVLFALTAGVDIVQVSYKGSGPAMIDVIGGHSQILIGAPIQTLPHVRTGKLKALGVTDSKRSSLLPDVPTIAQAGVPGYEAANWWGIAVPAGTPPPVIATLNAAAAAALASPQAQQQFAAEGAEVAHMGSQAFADFVQDETAKWGKVVAQAKVKAE